MLLFSTFYLGINTLTLSLLKGKRVNSRLNQVSVFTNREGVFYGQCSEICGVLHSSMPIVIESVTLEKFLIWLNGQ